MRVLPPGLGNLRGLTSLNVGSNSLSVVPDDVSQLSTLQRLTLSRNKLGPSASSSPPPSFLKSIFPAPLPFSSRSKSSWHRTISSPPFLSGCVIWMAWKSSISHTIASPSFHTLSVAYLTSRHSCSMPMPSLASRSPSYRPLTHEPPLMHVGKCHLIENASLGRKSHQHSPSLRRAWRPP